MKSRLLGAMALLFVSLSLMAQDSGILRGNVYDKETGDPIIYGNVYLENTTIGSTTDLEGFYSISDIAPGDYVVMATYIGYDTARVDVKVSAGSIKYEPIYLTQGGVNLGVVNISAQKQAARNEVKISELSVSQREIKSLPSVGGEPDIVQYLQVLPGIISTGDQGGQLYIRGGSPVQNKILLDGLTLYNPFHSIGFFSVFETDIISNVDVLTGGFNAEHGGRISAIVDINTRDGAKNRFGGYVSASPFIAKGLLEGPIVKFEEGGGSTSFILTAKKSLTEYTTKSLYSYAADNDTIGLPFNFQDIYGKVSFNNAGGSSLDLFGFNFQDEYNNPAIARIGWKNVGAGAKFKLVPSGSNIIIGGGAGFTNYNVGYKEGENGDRTSDIRELNATIDFTIFGNENEFKYGIDLRSIRTDFDFVNAFSQNINQTQSTTELSGFFKYRQRIAKKFIIEPSLRLMYYASQSVFSPEPRLGLKYNVTDKFRFKAAGGLYSQNILSTTNERDVVNLFSGFLTGPEGTVRDANGKELDNSIQRARHAVAGFEYDVTPSLSLNVEGYFKDFPQLIAVNREKLSTTESDYIKEEGQAYGVDFSVKFDQERYYIWATYSHGYVNRNDGIQEYPTVFDRRHNINTLITYNLDKAATWTASVRWNFGSGFPFTQTQGFYNKTLFDKGVSTDYTTENPDDIGIIFSDKRNGGRLPYYHRLDASISKRIEFSKYTNLEITASVTNIYNRNNIFYFDRIDYDRVDQLPYIPTIAAKVNF